MTRGTSSRATKGRRDPRPGPAPALALVACACGLLAGDVLIAAAALMSIAIWQLSGRWALPSAVPVMLTFHWVQITAGLFYQALTGREIDDSSQYAVAPMAYLGLVYLGVLLAGLHLGARGRLVLGSAPERRPRRAETRASARLWALSIPLGAVLAAFAWSVPGLTQQLLAVALLRFVLLTLLVQQLVDARAWRGLGLVLAVEIALGLTGYFSEFSRPVLLVIIVLLDRYRRGMREAGIGALALVVMLGGLALVWTGIKRDVRSSYSDSESRLDRLGRVYDRSAHFLEEGDLVDVVDRLVSRAWELEYPARVLQRVPRLIPHEDGALLITAIRHVTMPRALFPDKPRLKNDSELVRRYAGVRVAGEESGTSIGLSYVAESYIDFGMPGMFVPLFAFGLLVGALLGALGDRILDPRLRAAVITVLVSVSLNKFEVPWTKVLGSSLTSIVVVGVMVHLWQRRRRRRGERGGGSSPQTAAQAARSRSTGAAARAAER
ncbi:MAG: hypothetical protein KIT58_03325 [Planctomycetota bacterium]|nr:hypothetical protein [Planctomycetota bacterium]